MSSQNVATTLVYMAYNTSTGAYVTGDVANHTLKLVKDGTEASPTNAAAEVDSTNTPGAYKVALTAAETQFGTVWLGGKSSTANVIIVPITATFEILPTALDANNFVKADVEDWKASAVNALVGGKVDAVDSIRTGSAQAGAASTITLDSGASATNNLYNDQIVQILSGTGAGQIRPIIGYVGSTKVATVTPAWATNPDSTSVFVLVPSAFADVVSWLQTAVTAASAGIPDVNAKNINNVSTSGVTTINANQGTTQPVNFTGTGASALVKTDVTDIATVAVATGTAQLGVNVVNIAGQAAGLDANNLLKVDVEDINGSATAAQALNNSTNTICWGTCSGGTVTTAVVSTLNNPSSLTASGQLIGRTIIFLGSTSTGGVQAQASNITASTTGATPTITFSTMTTSPANGDKFAVL